MDGSRTPVSFHISYLFSEYWTLLILYSSDQVLLPSGIVFLFVCFFVCDLAELMLQSLCPLQCASHNAPNQTPLLFFFSLGLFYRDCPWANTSYLLAKLQSVQFSRLAVSDSLRPHESQHTRPPWPSPTPGVHSDSCPSSQWCPPAISSSVVPFSSCPQSLTASKSFPMSQLFSWGGQSIGVSASASVLPMNMQDWLPLGWTGWISLQSKGLSRVFSNTTVQKHQFFGAQPSSQSNSHIHTWSQEKP